MRLVLIANVRATTVTPRKIRFIERALAAEADVRLVHTRRRGHARELAETAADRGVDVVVVLGGDGTINEAANGLAGSDVPLAIIPGGGTNVLARSLGIPADPVRAAGRVLASLGGTPRRIPLGSSDGRYFAFTCGVGFDGAIVRRVERRQALKRTVGHAYYLWAGLREALSAYDRQRPKVRVRWGDNLGRERDGLFVAITQNTRPFTYLWGREMHVCPLADAHLGIDLLALDRMTLWYLLRTVVKTFTSGDHIRSPHALHLHDERRIEISCDEPLPAQMDGEYLGALEGMHIEWVPDALALLV